MNYPKFEVFQDRQKKWRFHLQAINNKILLQSEAYASKYNAERGIEAVQDAVASIIYGFD
jgi:uncharacterized protein YegP (UPF0339 family)